MHFWLCVGLFVAGLMARLTAEEPAVPLTGRRVADFVPSNWMVEQQVGGDLNADQRPDSVLMLIQQPQVHIKDNEGEPRKRVLVVVLTLPNGFLKRVGVGPHALYCTQCFGEAAELAPAKPAIGVERGYLQVKHTSGTRWVIEQTQYYRYEQHGGRVRLVAEKYTLTDRVEGRVGSVSTYFNLNGGYQRVSRGAVGKTPSIGAKCPITLPVRYLEDVNILSEISPWLPADLL